MHDSMIPHGSMVFVDSVIGQVLGLPSPPELVPVIPKYVQCLQSKWRRPGGYYCRIIDYYGPGGLASALEVSGIRERYDPMYASYMPYVESSRIQLAVTPREALEAILSRPPPEPWPAVEALEAIVGIVGSNGLGVTGSLAAGISHENSDLDLVSLDSKTSVSLYEFFRDLGSGPRKGVFGGLRVEPSVDLSWRRALVSGLRVTWIGSQPRCPVMTDYHSLTPPSRVWSGVVVVEPGQATALSYPPCVSTSQGWLVSYEFNLGGLLYEGGRFYVRGVSGGGVVYLGTREAPGYVRLLD